MRFLTTPPLFASTLLFAFVGAAPLLNLRAPFATSTETISLDQRDDATSMSQLIASMMPYVDDIESLTPETPTSDRLSADLAYINNVLGNSQLQSYALQAHMTDPSSSEGQLWDYISAFEGISQVPFLKQFEEYLELVQKQLANLVNQFDKAFIGH